MMLLSWWCYNHDDVDDPDGVNNHDEVDDHDDVNDHDDVDDHDDHDDVLDLDLDHDDDHDKGCRNNQYDMIWYLFQNEKTARGLPK